MKRTYAVAVAATLVAGTVLLVALGEPQPRLTILVNGSPAANLTVTDFQTGAFRKTDSTGTLTYDLDPEKQNAVFVPAAGGGQHLVSFPAKGHKTIDLRGRYTRSRIVVYDFGLLRHEKITEQYDLTDAETAAIMAGKITMSQAEKAIRKEAEQ